MFEKLESYLEEIDHYLAVEKGSDEILTEIKSHILDKTENDFGEINADNIEKTINGYGSPQKVAERYLEGYQIISPSFKKYLFRYSWILFCCHYGLIVLCYLLDIHIMMLPFNLVPRMHNIFDLIFQLPMTLVFDIGLVGIFLYFITQQKKELKLIWPRFFNAVEKRVTKKESRLEEPKIWLLLMFTVFFCGVLFVFLRFGTLFFKSFNLSHAPEPLFNPMGSILYSLVVIFLFAMEIIGYGIRFFKNTLWISLIKNCAYLVVFWWLLSYPPLENVLLEIPQVDINFFLASFFVLAIVGILIDSVVILFKIVREHLP